MKVVGLDLTDARRELIFQVRGDHLIGEGPGFGRNYRLDLPHDRQHDQFGAEFPRLLRTGK